MATKHAEGGKIMINQKGFTVIEVAIVVTIIGILVGILAALATQYQNYAEKKDKESRYLEQNVIVGYGQKQKTVIVERFMLNKSESGLSVIYDTKTVGHFKKTIDESRTGKSLLMCARQGGGKVIFYPGECQPGK